MAIFASKRRKRRASTPILSSDAAARVKERTQRAWERDVNNMVRERSAYRLMWPLVLILLTALNVILAGDYMIRIADAGGEVVWLGLTRNEFINWSIAFGLIVSGRILVVLLGDDETEGGNAWIGRIGVRLVIAGLIGFSIWTAAAETATKLQSKVDQGNAAAAHVQAAGQVVQATQDALAGAQQDLQIARNDLEAAKAQAVAARAEWAAYQADARQRYSGNDLAWVLNATHSQGPARPYIAAIQAANAGISEARRRVDALNAGVTAARGETVAAVRDRAQATETPGSEGTVVEAFGAMVPGWLGGPWSVATTIAVWGWIAAILLEVVCFAGAGATGRILREALASHDEARGGMADAIRKEAAAQAVRNAPVAPSGASGVIPRQNPDIPPVEPLSGAYGDEGQGGAVIDFAVRAKYADKIADAIADARFGVLTDASYPALKNRYRVGQGGADVIRAALVQEGWFVLGSGGTLVRVA